MGRLGAMVLIALSSCVLFGPARTVAQDATPATGLGQAIDPAECQVEPRSADELIALWYAEDGPGTPVLATPEPPADVLPTSVPVPLGVPADPTTVAETEALLREVIACFNGGDFLRATALFTDRFARQFGPEPGTPVEAARAFLEAPPEPRPAEARWRLIVVTDVSVMADGRIAAVAVSDDPVDPPAGPETEVVFLVEEDGRLVGDGVAELTVVEEEQGTPAP